MDESRRRLLKFGNCFMLVSKEPGRAAVITLRTPPTSGKLLLLGSKKTTSGNEHHQARGAHEHAFSTWPGRVDRITVADPHPSPLPQSANITEYLRAL